MTPRLLLLSLVAAFSIAGVGCQSPPLSLSENDPWIAALATSIRSLVAGRVEVMETNDRDRPVLFEMAEAFRRHVRAQIDESGWISVAAERWDPETRTLIIRRFRVHRRTGSIRRILHTPDSEVSVHYDPTGRTEGAFHWGARFPNDPLCGHQFRLIDQGRGKWTLCYDGALCS